MPSLPALLNDVVARFDDRPLTGWHALCAGVLDGSWAGLEAGVTIGADPKLVDAAQLKARAQAWRRERGLIAGEELRRWLTDRGLTTDDWRAHLARAAAGPGAPPSAPCAGAALDAALTVDLLCSGVLDALARTLLRWAAARHGLSAAEQPAAAEIDRVAAALRERADATISVRAAGGSDRELVSATREVAELSLCHEAFAAGHVTSRMLDEHLRERRMAWCRIQWREARFATESAAREAAMMVAIDRSPLSRPAELAGVVLAERAQELGELDRALESRLAGARAGQLVGPWAVQADWVVIEVHDRAEPTLGDARVRERAQQELLGDLLAHDLTERGWLRWR